MPQVSLYIDEITLRRIETAAKTERLSLSKYVSMKLRKSLADEWPEHYDGLFGAIEDGSFVVETQTVADVRRESL
ncbi:MAG: hypothetical protein KAU31_04545 [Spirochaetaceae bacterium]|nr:hypothetical protein [Spirochaetaceae bacterium]